MRYQEAALLDKTELFQRLKTSEAGLTNTQATENKTYGANTLAAHEIKWWGVLSRQFKSSFVYLLIAASAISLALGEIVDGVLILAFVAINTGLGFWQEYKASVSLNKLRHFITKTSAVIRDGKAQTINDSEIVVGDLVLLRAGDLIPAEVRFVTASGVTVDEGTLTGESSPVSKVAEYLQTEPASISESKNIGFSGTLVTSGEATAVVVSVGNETEVGSLAKLAVEAEADSAFSKEIAGISKAVIYLMLGTITAVVILHLFIKGPSVEIGKLAVFAIALAVGVVPEALPLVITISLSTGALSLAKKKVVPKRLSAIEDLGAIDILCMDKTGTITENRLAVTETLPIRKDLLYLAALAIDLPKSGEIITDPFDRALWAKLSETERESILSTPRISELPFDPTKRTSSALVDTGTETLIVRGAYEEVIEACTNGGNLNFSSLEAFIRIKGEEGKRVLAVATKEAKTHAIEGLHLAGLIAFSDPLKATAQEAIREARSMNVTLKILTGDSSEVATSVGRATGLIKGPQDVITGKHYESLSESEKDRAVLTYTVFSRVSPKEKFDILKRLQKDHFVGFLGEGFNDAPAIKASNVGLVVNNASDVAKEAADIVLLSKDLPTIVDGIKEGRKTFTNTVKYIRTTLASNFGNFFALAASSLFIPFLPMLPIQILLLNLLSDFPMISVSTDNVSRKALKKPSRYRVSRIILLCVLLGLVSTAFDFTTFFYFVRFGEKTLQTLWFMESTLTEVVLLFSVRATRFFLKTSKPSKPIVILTAITIASVILIPISPVGQRIFGFTAPTLNDLKILGILVTSYFLLTEAVKLAYYKALNKEAI